MKRIAWITATLIAGGALMMAYMMYTNPTPDYASREPHFTLQASTLLSAFEQNPEQASRNYVEKIVRVSGVVKMVDTSGSLVMTGDQPSAEIIFAMDPRHKASLFNKRKGETVTVQGICGGYAAGSADAADMLAALGATLRFHSAGIKQ